MKSRVPLLPLVFLSVTLFAQRAIGQDADTPWWYALEQGKHLFRGGGYGDALLSFEDARRQRFAVYDRMERDFVSLLSLNEVRRLGDSLEWVERYADERHYSGALAALEELFYRYPKDGFNNSAAAALQALGGLKQYPEAEYWIGETYRVEGELSLALRQYRKTLEIRGIAENPKSPGEYRRVFEYQSQFESPDFDIDLLYKIAEIHKIRQEYNVMERTLLSILAGDSLWASSSFARQAMSRTLENDGLERFFTLYRYNNTQVEQAHRLLGFFYALSGRPSAQEHLMFAFLIQNSVLIEEAGRRQLDFAFTGLAALGEEINRVPLLADYAAQTDYYKTAYYLALSLYSNGKAASARELWTFLASVGNSGEWQNRAAGQLRRPHTEPVVEMP